MAKPASAAKVQSPTIDANARVLKTQPLTQSQRNDANADRIPSLTISNNAVVRKSGRKSNAMRSQPTSNLRSRKQGPGTGSERAHYAVERNIGQVWTQNMPIL
jgi:hypothetical protein